MSEQECVGWLIWPCLHVRACVSDFVPQSGNVNDCAGAQFDGAALVRSACPGLDDEWVAMICVHTFFHWVNAIRHLSCGKSLDWLTTKTQKKVSLQLTPTGDVSRLSAEQRAGMHRLADPPLSACAGLCL